MHGRGDKQIGLDHSESDLLLLPARCILVGVGWSKNKSSISTTQQSGSRDSTPLKPRPCCSHSPQAWKHVMGLEKNRWTWVWQMAAVTHPDGKFCPLEGSRQPCTYARHKARSRPTHKRSALLLQKWFFHWREHLRFQALKSAPINKLEPPARHRTKGSWNCF
jgi:hypothetical protein